MWCSEVIGTTGGGWKLTVVAGHGLDEDLHRLLGVGAGGAHAADAGGTGHGCGCGCCGCVVERKHCVAVYIEREREEAARWRRDGVVEKKTGWMM